MLRAAEGFTIIEVTIFLAISGMLLLMMFIGTGSMATRQRFTDTVDSLQVFFQSQYDEVANGVNVRTAGVACSSDASASTVPGKSKCLLLGKLLYINGTTITASYVISTQSPTNETNDRTKLQTAGLQVVSAGQTAYELKWGASASVIKRSDATTVNSIAFLRVPDSNNTAQLYYSGTGAVGALLSSSPAFDAAAYNPTGDSATPSLRVCIQNTADYPVAAGRPTAAIRFGQGLGAGVITTDYEPGVLCT